MSHPGVPEHVVRNKYQAAQLRLGVTDAALPALQQPPQAAPHPMPASPSADAAFSAPAATDLPPLPSIPTFSGPADLTSGGRVSGSAGFRPRYPDATPEAARQTSLRNSTFQESGAARFRSGNWGLLTGRGDQTSLVAGAVAGLVLVRMLWHGVPNGRAIILVVPALFALGLVYRQWQKKRVAQRRFDQVTRIRPAWTRHNAVSCRSLGVGVKRAGSVWLADDGTSKDLVLAWSRDGFEIYGGERSLTRIISISWQDIVEVRTERAAVGQKKGQAGLAIVTKSNAVLTAALRPEPTGYRKFRSRPELAPVVTQLRQFL